MTESLIYPPELEIKETTDTASSASFLDLYLEFDDTDQLSTNIYDKRDDFNFIVFTKDAYSIDLSLFGVSAPFNVLSYGHLALVLPHVICLYDWLIILY
jgi:hypothetical protein